MIRKSEVMGPPVKPRNRCKYWFDHEYELWDDRYSRWIDEKVIARPYSILDILRNDWIELLHIGLFSGSKGPDAYSLIEHMREKASRYGYINCSFCTRHYVNSRELKCLIALCAEYTSVKILLWICESSSTIGSMKIMGMVAISCTDISLLDTLHESGYHAKEDILYSMLCNKYNLEILKHMICRAEENDDYSWYDTTKLIRCSNITEEMCEFLASRGYIPRQRGKDIKELNACALYACVKYNLISTSDLPDVQKLAVKKDCIKVFVLLKSMGVRLRRDLISYALYEKHTEIARFINEL